MGSLSLEELAERVSEKYAPFDVPMGEAGTVRLRQVLRLPKEQKRQVIEIQQELNGLQTEKKDPETGDVIELTVDEQLDIEPKQIECFQAIFRIVADDQELVELMLKQIGDDVASLLELFNAYQETTQAGEASASSSS
jgi:hypothetical protein